MGEAAAIAVLKLDATVKPRLALLKRFAEFSNLYPWQWQPGEVEAFLDHLRGRRATFAVSEARNYQNAIRMFCDYITDERYDWPKVCYDSFRQQPA
ncbi:integrase [Streptomyces apocyni]|uniref:integrase n=1 Tax=Streptomyces apocyni TaxID=2654677 RepID=UPI0018D0C9D0|nr:integrase [Streptomyces apocyni]